MENIADKIFLGGVGVLTALLGGWHLTIQILLILMGIDILTGLFKGLYHCTYTSRQFREGIVHKGGYILILILSFQIDLLMGNSEPVVRTIVATFYIAIEGTSILENLGEVGVPVPKFIKDRLSKLKEAGDSGSEVE